MSPGARSGPGSPAGRTSAATPGSPRWPGPAGTPGSAGGSACSADSRPPGGCTQSGWHCSPGYLFHRILVQPPVNMKIRVKNFSKYRVKQEEERLFQGNLTVLLCTR